MLRVTIVVASIGTICLLTSRAGAHDLKGAVLEMTDSLSPSIARALAATPRADYNTRSVLNNLRLWPIPRKLTICFLAGAQNLRKRVAAAAHRNWPLAELTEGRLDFDPSSLGNTPDCGEGKADIRVAFDPQEGNFSYVGMESLVRYPSMNLGGLTETSPEPVEFDRIVGHEFGHALGLEHEHKSPGVKKCEWNFDYISKNYKWKNEREMRSNFETLQDFLVGTRHAFIYSTPDKKSIMYYFFGPEGFINGTKSPCYIKAKNYGSSMLDRNALRIAYGPDAEATQGQMKGLVVDPMKAFPGAEYKGIRDLLNLKTTLLGQ